MRELINVTERKLEVEFVQTIGNNLVPENAKQGAIIKIAEKPLGGGWLR